MDRDAALEMINTEIVPSIAAHTVVLARIPREGGEARPDWLKGSGILTKIESTSSFGIITAGHVVEALRQEHEEKDPEEIALLLRPAGAAGGHGALPLLRLHVPKGTITAWGRDNENLEGPDLAWIPLPVEVARSIEEQKGSSAVFYNVEHGELRALQWAEMIRDGERRAPEFGTGILAYAVGWNHEKQIEAGGRDMTIWVCEAIPDGMEQREGWIYSDYIVQGNNWNHLFWDDERGRQGDEVFEHPGHWGGISGGGVWHVFESPEREEERMVKQLAGVIYYEHVRDGQIAFRTHWSPSIRRILNEARVDGQEQMRPEQFDELLDGIIETPESDAVD